MTTSSASPSRRCQRLSLTAVVGQKREMRVLRVFSLLWRRFTPVEIQLLDLVGDALPEKEKRLFCAQRKKINKVQRLLDWTSIEFFCMRLFKPHWDKTVNFPGFPARSAIRIAEVRFSIGHSSFKSVLWAVSGHIFELVTRPSIRELAFEAIDSVHQVKILCDFSAPQDESNIEKETLPKTYLDYVDNSPVTDVGEWQILLPPEVYRVSLRSGDFIVLAATKGGDWFLVSKEDEMPQQIYRIATHDEDTAVERHSFAEALQIQLA